MGGKFIPATLDCQKIGEFLIKLGRLGVFLDLDAKKSIETGKKKIKIILNTILCWL